MSAEENKAVVRQLTGFFDKGEVARADELVAADFVDHNALPGQNPGREGLKQAVTMISSAFPDIQITDQDFIAEGDRVVHRWNSRFTHQSEFMGIPPTGKPVTLTGIDVYRLADGKVVERWSEVDMLGLMQQLGVIPAPGQVER
jgi:steroid delta-isomerase-like uncharacterized protein